MDKKAEFIRDSIIDIQGTIKALDAKFFGTIALYLLPVTEIDKISEAYKSLHLYWPIGAIIALTILMISWLLGLIISFAGIYSISNPVKSIKGVTKANAKGIFFQPNIFRFNIFTQFKPGSNKSNKTFMEIVDNLKLEDEAIFKELVFEQIKLVFIRDIKTARQKSAMILLLLTIVLIVGGLIINYFLA